MEKKDILIVGGGPAGFSAARTILSLYPERKVTVINDGKNTQIPCSIPFVIGRKIKPEENIYPLNKLASLGAEIIVEKVTSIDSKGGCVFLSSGKNLSFEKLVIATGWIPRRLPFETPENVEYISTNTEFIKSLLERIKEARNITIIGAGLIGIGFAEAIASGYKGKSINVIELSKHIAGGILSSEVETEVLKRLESIGVNLFLNSRVESFEGKDKVESVKLSNGENLKSDLVLVFIGFKPNSKLAVDAGIKVNEHGEIIVDSFMRTSIDNIFAAGSCVEHISAIDRKRTPAMLASVSSADGRLAALNVNGPRFGKKGTVAAGVSKVGDLFFGFSGFTEKICTLKGIQYATGTSQSSDRYPKAMGGKEINVKLTFSENGKLLGGEVWGKSEKVSTYLNLITRMVESEYSIESVISAGTVAFPASTPSPLSSPVQLAAVNAMKKL